MNMSEVTKITTSNAKIYVEGKPNKIVEDVQEDERNVLDARMHHEAWAAQWFEFKELKPSSSVSPYNGYFYRRETVRIKSTAIQCLESMGDCDIR